MVHCVYVDSVLERLLHSNQHEHMLLVIRRVVQVQHSETHIKLDESTHEHFAAEILL